MSDDIIIVERPREARRIVVTAPGRFSFADVRDARGERRVFGCHAVNPSIREIVIASPVTAKMDARVIAYIDHLGKLDGMVTCVLQRGFVMGVNVKQTNVASWLRKSSGCSNTRIPKCASSVLIAVSYRKTRTRE